VTITAEAVRRSVPAGLAEPAVGARRAVFHVVPGTPGHGAGEQASVLHAERRAQRRRLADDALAAEIASSPLVMASVFVACILGLATADNSAWLIAWVVMAAVVAAAWLALAWCGARRPRLLRDTRRHRLAVGAIAMAAIALVGATPWLPMPVGMDRTALLVALGALAVSAAAVFCAMKPVAAAAIVLPLSDVLSQWWRAPPAQVPDRAVILAGVSLSAIAALVAFGQHRRWLMRARRSIEREDRSRSLEAQRDDALQADQEKSRFLAIASHDLRQPVHALGLFAATLEKRLQGTGEEPLVRNLVRSIDGLDRSFCAMLDISRLDAGTVEPNFQHFPLRDLFRRLHMHFAGQAELAGLGLRFSPGGKSVTSDPQLLERILGNLIQNAIKYTRAGGIVVVVRTTESHFNVEVWDTGMGISAAELPRVFDEFYQADHARGARAQGLGMGLAIVKRLVRLLGHTLTVASQPGRGSMFRIGIARGALPEIQDVTAAADTLPMPALQPRTVLVIDDEEPIREGLVMLLEEWGYQALAAGTLDEARHIMRMLELPPDLILSDLHLGDGPDGIAAIETVRRECGCELPAILVTGDTSHEEMRRAGASGHPVLFKPVQPHKLLNAMRGLVS